MVHREKRQRHILLTLYYPSRWWRSATSLSAPSIHSWFSVTPEFAKVIFWSQPTLSQDEIKRQRLGFNAEVFEEDLKNNELWQLVISADAPVSKLYNESHVLDAQFFPNSDHLLITASDSSLEDAVLNPFLVKLDKTGRPLERYRHIGKIDKAVINQKGNIAFIRGAEKSDPAAGQLFVLDEQLQSSSLILTNLKGHIKDIIWQSNKQVGLILQLGTQPIWASKNVRKVSDNYKVLHKSDLILNQISMDKNAQQFAFIGNHPSHPNEAFWYARSNFIKISDANPWLKEVTLPEQQLLSFNARDGLTLEGIYVAPLHKQSDEGHGNIHATAQWDYAHRLMGWMEHYVLHKSSSTLPPSQLELP